MTKPHLASRREFAQLLGSMGAVAALSCEKSPPAAESGSAALADPLHYTSASQFLRALERKTISSEELVGALLERIQAVNPKLNAVVQLVAGRALAEARKADSERVRGQIRGPLHGLPITLKDSIDTAGVISTGGTKGRAAFVPEADATVAARLRAAGAILLGKTNTPELTFSYETTNLVYGQTSNPYDVSRSPGGSSGGAAAIIAAGGSPLDIGSDTGGSIRYPAHCCGIAGIKPTSGRVPRTGHIVPFGGTLDFLTQLGPLARSVDDLILALPVIAGPDWRDPAIVPAPLGDPAAVDLSKLRICFHTDNGVATPTPEIIASVRNAAQALSARVPRVEEKRPAGIEQTTEIFFSLVRADGGIGTRKLLDQAGTTESWLKPTGRDPVSFPEFLALFDRWDGFRMEMTRFFENYDVILSPACAIPAPPQGEVAKPSFRLQTSYTQTYNLTGWPGAVVRCGTSPEGLSIGVQVIARPWREDVALAVAKHLEETLGGFQPPAIG